MDTPGVAAAAAGPAPATPIVQAEGAATPIVGEAPATPVAVAAAPPERVVPKQHLSARAAEKYLLDFKDFFREKAARYRENMHIPKKKRDRPIANIAKDLAYEKFRELDAAQKAIYYNRAKQPTQRVRTHQGFRLPENQMEVDQNDEAPVEALLPPPEGMITPKKKKWAPRTCRELEEVGKALAEAFIENLTPMKKGQRRSDLRPLLISTARRLQGAKQINRTT